MKRHGLLLGLTMLATVLAPGLASAEGYAARYPYRQDPAPSVFPVPQNPWRNWGVREYNPGVPYYPSAPYYPSVPSHATWVPGYWQWNGYQWLWIPGYWVW